MDRSQRNVSLSTLRATLETRSDGYWELLATAAGAYGSVARTEESLSVEALRLGSHGQATAPSIVRERVEALAAWNPLALARLTVGWFEPRDIGDDPWWTAAWSTALRHLKSLGPLERDRFDVPSLAAEVALLWDDGSPRGFSWRQLVSPAVTPLSFESARALASARMMETTLSKNDLITCPLSMLRLLRGRANLLDISAIDHVIARARSWQDQDPLESALALEVCQEASVEEDVIDCIRMDVIEHVSAIRDPRHMLPFVYVLLGEWKVP